MLELLLIFLFLFKLNYRQTFAVGSQLSYLYVFVGVACTLLASKCIDSLSCNGNGECKNETCICYDGWQGPQYQLCDKDKIRLDKEMLNGTIHDVFGNYSVKCIDAPKGNEKQCIYYSTCDQCRYDPACGWCDDGSKTGLGKCMPGGYAGPTLHTHPLPSSTCPQDYWHFTTCPLCQCYGHAECVTNTSTCKECDHFTKGSQCEECIEGYWGNPVNGGSCQCCECNGQATQCNSETGKCYCTTKGLAGDHCEKCDAMNRYHGDPTNKGSCYYDLIIDYHFTFNLSKKEDRHYTQINFRNSPTKPDIDTKFTITCSVNAKLNITIKSVNSSEEKTVLSNQTCFKFKLNEHTFTKSDYSFGIEDNVTLTTFYVYVYDFQTPLWIQISFSQFPGRNPKHFVITISLCFVLFLVFAAILWKINKTTCIEKYEEECL